MQVAKKIPGFTLLEIVVMIIVFSTGMVGIFAVLRQGIQFSERTRQDVIAINLAREGVEGVINIRDTNRLRRAGRKDQCRLKSDPLLDESNEGCEDDTRIQSGSYNMLYGVSDQQRYVLLNSVAIPLDVSAGVKPTDLSYSLCLVDSAWIACPGSSAVTVEGQYFRSIAVVGLFAKDTATIGGDALVCPAGNVGNCGDIGPKELRYCSRVEYQGRGFGQVNLCMILTNFAK